MTRDEVLSNPFLVGRLNLYGGGGGEGSTIGVIDVFEKEHGHNIVSCINDELCGTAPGARVIKYNISYPITVDDVVRALKECIVDEVDIINMSFGFGYNPYQLEKAIKECDNQGILMVAAAGNYGKEYKDTVDLKLWPEEYPEVISCGSVDNKLEWSKFESHGKSIDLVGFGEAVVVKMRDGSYQFSYGTSDVTGHISGLFACLLSKYRQRGESPTSEELKRIMLDKAIDLGVKGKDNFYGTGFATLLEYADFKEVKRGLGIVSRTVTMQINNQLYLVDGEEKIMDTQPIIDENNRTLVPVRAIAEALGCEVKWIPETQTIIIIE